jgi:hypothetical protein
MNFIGCVKSAAYRSGFPLSHRWKAPSLESVAPGTRAIVSMELLNALRISGVRRPARRP